LEGDEGGDWISGEAEDEKRFGEGAMSEEEGFAGFDFDLPQVRGHAKRCEGGFNVVFISDRDAATQDDDIVVF